VAARRRGDEGIHRHLPEISLCRADDMAEKFADCSGQIRAAEHLVEMSFIACNQARLLVNSRETFDAMFSGIASARNYLLLEFYILRTMRWDANCATGSSSNCRRASESSHCTTESAAKTYPDVF
jgi:cardiolipin synthase